MFLYHLYLYLSISTHTHLEQATTFCAQINCIQKPLEVKGISFPAAPLCWRPAWGRFAAFPPGLHPLLALRCCLHGASPGAPVNATQTSWPGFSERPQSPASPALPPSRPGRGLAPQLSAGWSRRRARGPAIGPSRRLTWSRADKRPLRRCTRNPPELQPSRGCWEPGANSRRQRSPAAPLPNELHQVGSL